MSRGLVATTSSYLQGKVSACWSAIVPSILVTTLAEVKIKPSVLVTWPSCYDVFITHKVKTCRSIILPSLDLATHGELKVELLLKINEWRNNVNMSFYYYLTMNIFLRKELQKDSGDFNVPFSIKLQKKMVINYGFPFSIKLQKKMVINYGLVGYGNNILYHTRMSLLKTFWMCCKETKMQWLVLEVVKL